MNDRSSTRLGQKLQTPTQQETVDTRQESPTADCLNCQLKHEQQNTTVKNNIMIIRLLQCCWADGGAMIALNSPAMHLAQQINVLDFRCHAGKGCAPFSWFWCTNWFSGNQSSFIPGTEQNSILRPYAVTFSYSFPFNTLVNFILNACYQDSHTIRPPTHTCRLPICTVMPLCV